MANHWWRMMELGTLVCAGEIEAKIEKLDSSYKWSLVNLGGQEVFGEAKSLLSALREAESVIKQEEHLRKAIEKAKARRGR